jgi:hypothetical protein
MKNGEKPASSQHPDMIINGIGTGLTKREHFAAMALQGLATNANMPIDITVKLAIRMADDLLKELEK